MMAFTSAKSRLMMPGTVMMSEMPCTAWRRMSSAMRNASKKLVPRSTVSIRRSLGITMTVSTAPINSWSACSDCIMRRLPSNRKGFVTTATLSAPNSLASEATTGAAPLPVPPPRPGVMKIMSEPSSASMIFSVSSSAALRPTSGLAPAPSPLVSLAPSCSFMGACDSFSACRSVFAVMNSTPSSLARIMRLTALHPPPPTPMTLIFAGCSSSLKLMRIPASLVVIFSPTFSTLAGSSRAGSRGAGEHGFQFGYQISPALRRRAPRLRAIQNQAHYGCIFRLRHLFRQIGQAFGFRDAHGQMEGLLDQVSEPVQAGAAVAALEPFRLRNGRAQANGEIIGEVIASDRNGATVTHHASAEDKQFGGAAADVQEATAEVALVLREAGFRGSERFENCIGDEDSSLVRVGDEILGGGDGGSDEMNVHFQPLANHADGVANAVLRIHHEFVRKDMKDFAVFGQGDVASGVDGAAHVFALDVSRTLTQSDAAAAVYPAHVAAGDADERLFHWHVCNTFGFFDRAPYGTHRGIEIDDEALAQPFGLRSAEGQELHKFAIDFSDQNASFCTADVQPNQVFVSLRQAAAPAMKLFCSCRRGARTGVGIHDHLPRILQIDGLHAAGIRLPLRKIVDQHFVLAAELARAEVNRDSLRLAGVRKTGHHHSQILQIGEIDLADAIGRAGSHEVDILDECLMSLHALFAPVSRHFFRDAGDNGKVQFFAARTVEDDTMRVNQPQFVAIAGEGDGNALGQLDAQTIRQDALHAGGFDPGNLF